MYEIVRLQAEIDAILNKLVEIVDKQGTKFPGMSYEQGMLDFWEWLTSITEKLEI